jgi:predicted nucleic acid-binding Zn finger protein
MAQEIEKPEPIFKVGDIVQHVVSKNKGIIIRIIFNDEYVVSSGFNGPPSLLPAIALEPWVDPAAPAKVEFSKSPLDIIQNLSDGDQGCQK